jgi:hypothetical protein
MALGSYPDMELAAARKAARAKRTLVDAGRDPLLEKLSEIEAQLKASAARKARGKFKELAEDWYETEIEGGHLKHPAVPRRYLDKYMLPEFGSAVPADITPAMAARLLARVAKKAPTAANDLLRYMRRVFRFAVRRHLMASSPVADFNLSDAGRGGGALPQPQTARPPGRIQHARLLCRAQNRARNVDGAPARNRARRAKGGAHEIPSLQLVTPGQRSTNAADSLFS